MPELVLIRGLPGSGKSTLAKQMHTHIHLETDQYWHRLDPKTYAFDATKLPEAHAWCLRKTKDLLDRGFNVVVSNTFTTKKEMQPYIDLGYPVKFYTTTGNYNNTHNVPQEVIDRMKQRWEEI